EFVEVVVVGDVLEGGGFFARWSKVSARRIGLSHVGLRRLLVRRREPSIEQSRRRRRRRERGAANERPAVPEESLLGNLAAFDVVGVFDQHCFTSDGSLNQRATIIAHSLYYH